jgi:hypothetical protein
MVGDVRSAPFHGSSPASWSASKAAFASRLLLGSVLLAASLNNLLARNPVSSPTQAGNEFLAFLEGTGYLLLAVSLTELVTALLVLWGRFIPLALLLFAPVLVNIFLFHLFVQWAGVEVAVLVAVPYLHLAYVFRERFASVVAP